MKEQEHIEQIYRAFEGTYSSTLGLCIESYHPGYCRGYLPLTEKFLNPMGVIHGGFLFIIADTVGGVAATRLNSGQSATTISGNINFMRAVQDIDRLYVEANVLAEENNILFVEANVSSKDGLLYATVNLSYANIPVNL